MDGRVVLVALGMSLTGLSAGEPLLAAELAEPTEVFGSLREYFEVIQEQLHSSTVDQTTRTHNRHNTPPA